MSLNYERRGSGDPLVLIHGIGSHWQVFKAVLDRLAAERDVIAIDLPGFGASPPDGTGPTIEAQAGRVVRFFDELGLDRPHVAGNSMGGAIALELARRGVVGSATAVSPAGFWTDRERAFCQRSLRFSRWSIPLMRPALPAVVSTAPGRMVLFTQTFGRPWLLDPQDCLDTVDAFTGAQGFDACLAAFDEYVLRQPDELRGVPVTIAWGSHDWLLIPRQARRAQHMLPWARHVTLPGLGHAPFNDDPELLATVLLDGSRPASAAAPAPAPADQQVR